MKKFMTYLPLIGLFAFTSCKDKVEPDPVEEDPTMLQVNVYPEYNGQTLYLDSTYTTDEGYDIQFTGLKFFAENVINGSTQLIDAGLFDYGSNGNLLLEAAGEPSTFGSLQGNIGVQSSINHNDPSAFPVTSVLNIMNANDMHWSWNPGYIFFKVEGKADTIPDGNELFDHTFVFHVGLDENLQTFDFNNLNWQLVDSKRYKLNMMLDMHEFLSAAGNEIDLKTEYTTHSAAGQEVLTAKAALNFKNALTVN